MPDTEYSEAEDRESYLEREADAGRISAETRLDALRRYNERSDFSWNDLNWLLEQVASLTAENERLDREYGEVTDDMILLQAQVHDMERALDDTSFCYRCCGNASNVYEGLCPAHLIARNADAR